MKKSLLYILPSALSLILWGFGITSDMLVLWLEQNLSYKQLLATASAILLITLNIIYHLAMYVFSLKKQQASPQQPLSEEAIKIKLQPSLKISNGIYFDQQGNAFCPICQTLMTQSSPQYGFDEHSYYCPKCNKFFPIDPNKKYAPILPFTV